MSRSEYPFEVEGTVANEDWWAQVRHPLNDLGHGEAAMARYRAMFAPLVADSLTLCKLFDFREWIASDRQAPKLTLIPRRPEAALLLASLPPGDDPRLVQYRDALYRDGRLVGYIDAVHRDQPSPVYSDSVTPYDFIAPGPPEIELTPAIGPAPGDDLEAPAVCPKVAVAYQDESGDLYCPAHKHDGDRPYEAWELAGWTNADALRCDFCGANLLGNAPETPHGDDQEPTR